MLRNYLKILFIGIVVSLTSCSMLGDKVITNRDTDYLKARTTPPLVIPPGLSSGKIESLYPIPERNYSERSKQIDLVPPELK